MALMVRRVVCAYRQGFLPGDWLQTWRRLQRLLQRARFDVKATLAPLDELPSDTDVLLVPPDLREDARAAVPPGDHRRRRAGRFCRPGPAPGKGRGDDR